MTPAADTAVVQLGDAPPTIADVEMVAGGARVELGRWAIERIKASREVVEELVKGEALIYGLNTGLGHMRDQRMPPEVLRQYQLGTLLVHDAGIGAPLPESVVRAAMFTRVAGIARGGAGATLAAAETLVAMLNRRVHPVVPAIGSVGAADLMHMTSIAMVATGQGRASVNGSMMSGAEALSKAGIAPLVMEPKDALALISANGVSVGHGALVVGRAMRTAEAIDIVAALSLESARGNPSIVEAAVAAAKPIAGQAESARRVWDLLAGSRLCTAGGPASVQDPLSFRVIPQVHGALRELVGFAQRAVEDELASMDDNPLVLIEERRIVSNGNFHPMLMALAFDALRPALAHVGLLSQRRTGHHFEAMVADPEVFSDGGIKLAGHSRGGFLLAYAATARYTELRQLAAPATLDIPALDLGVEDHATNAPLTVRRTEEALDILDDLLAAELLTCATRIVVVHDVERLLAPATSRALAAVEGAVAEAGADAAKPDIHAAVRALLPGRLLASVG